MKKHNVRNAIFGTISLIVVTGLLVLLIWFFAGIKRGTETTVDVTILAMEETGESQVVSYTGYSDALIDLGSQIPKEQEGYKFSGWFEDEKLTIKLSSVNSHGDPIFAKKDFKIYGKLEKEFQLTYESGEVVYDFTDFPKAIIHSEAIVLSYLQSEGYVFSHYEIKGKKVEKNQLVSISEDTLINALFVPQKLQEVSVDFYTDGAIESLVGAPGELLNLPNTVIAGKEFVGWFTDAAYTNAYLGGNVFPKASLQLHAKYVLVNKITYSSNVAGEVTHNNPVKFYAEVLHLQPAFLSGYTFEHWLLNGTQIILPNIAIDGASLIGTDITLEAIFQINSPADDFITIIFVDTLGNVESVNVNYDSKVSSAPGLPSNPSKLGYKFLFWSVDGSAEYDLETLITASDLDFNLTAVFDKVLVYLEFIGDDNSVIETTTVLYDSKLTVLPTAPAKTNHKFSHYERVDNQEVVNSQTIFSEINTDTTPLVIKAIYTKVKVNVVLKVPGEIDQTLNGEPGKAMVLPTMVKPGYQFTGWHMDEGLTIKYQSSNFPDQDLTIHGDWLAEVTLTYDSLVTGFTHTNKGMILENEIITLTPAYKTDYEFLGWFNSLDGKIETVDGAGGNQTITAKFKIIPPTRNYITILFVDTLGNVESVNVNYDSKVSSAPGLPSNPSKLGYKFLFWSVDGSAEYDLETLITASDLDFNLTAVFDKVLVYLEFIGDDNSVIETTTVLYDSKLTVLPTAPAKTNHKFSHYERVDNQEVVNSQTIFSEINTDTTPLVIKAIYTKVKVNVVLKVPGEIDQTLNGEPGKAMVLPTMVKPGYQFTGWHMDEGLTIKYQSSNFPDQDLTIHGDWLAEVTLTYDSLVTGFTHTNKPLILENEIITLTPAYKTDYEFLGWFNSLDGKIETVDGAGGDQTITAKFKIIPPTRNYITILFADTLGSVVSVIVPFNTKVSDAPNVPTDPVKLGYEFLYWDNEGELYELETVITETDVDLFLIAIYYAGSVHLLFVDDADGDIVGLQVEYDGKLSFLPVEPALANHQFSHYERVDNQSRVTLETIFSEINEITSPIVIKAKYIKTHVDVTLSVSGEPDQVMNGKPGAAMTLSTPVKPGYQFSGWHMDQGLTIKYQSSNFPDQDLTIHGDWLAEVTLTYDSLVTGFAHNNKVLILENEVITLTPAYRTGHEFVGWFNNLGVKIETVDGVNGNQTITAKFTIIPEVKYYITYISKPGTSNPNTLTEFTNSTPNYVLLNVTHPGYNFQHFDIDGQIMDLFIPAHYQSNVVIQAIFDEINPIIFNITYLANVYENGTATPIVGFVNPNVIVSFDVTDELVFARPSNDHMIFKGWFNTKTGKEVFEITQGSYSDLELEARFEHQLYRVTFDANGSQFVSDGSITSYQDLKYGTIFATLTSELAVNNLSSIQFPGNYSNSKRWWSSKGIEYLAVDDSFLSDLPKALYLDWEGEFLYELAVDHYRVVEFHADKTNDKNMVLPTFRKKGLPITELSPSSEAAFGGQIYESITISESYTRVGVNAFNGASFLTQKVLQLPSTLKYIDSYAFFNFSNITEIKLPEGLILIGEFAFAVDALAIGAETVNFVLVIPSTVTSIGLRAFSERQLFEVDLSKTSLTTIADGTFYAYPGTGGSLTKVTFTDTITVIGDRAFSHQKITQLKLPAKLKEIHTYAFVNNPITGVLSIPSKVSRIYSYAFQNTSITGVTFNGALGALSELRVVDSYAFANNPGLAGKTLDFSHTYIETIGRSAFSTETTGPAVVILNNANPPSTGHVVAIGYAAFMGGGAPAGTKVQIRVPSALLAAYTSYLSTDKYTITAI